MLVSTVIYAKSPVNCNFFGNYIDLFKKLVYNIRAKQTIYINANYTNSFSRR